RYILGHWPLEEAIRQMQKDTRRYAKRQITWFKGEKEFIWLKPDQFEILLKRSEGFLC
ncbi:MAG: tRNA (adenosine(37)-N6)-dimethylallyltransferase MiaA, partial [Deltaproteobacteria bacterium]